MTLTLDIGNTTIALAVLDGDYNVLFDAKIPSDANFPEPLKNALYGLRVNSAAISSVVPELTEPVRKAVSEFCGVVPAVISAEMYRGILDFAIPEPEKLGLDRIADSAWAASNYPLPAVTVDIGTAATFNVIGKGGVFLGGIIAAGIRTSLDALCKMTAQLPNIAPDVPENVIGKNTRECMLSGAVFGAAAMVEGVISRVEKELKSPASRILTGGDARLVLPLLDRRESYIYEPFLTAKGIAFRG